MKKLLLDKVKMNVIETASNGIVNKETIFIFSQTTEFVSASYSGGQIVQGYLVGYFENDKLFFSYCQLQTDGKADNGQSVCDIIAGPNGKVMMMEKFSWTSKQGETGMNIFQEL